MHFLYKIFKLYYCTIVIKNKPYTYSTIIVDCKFTKTAHMHNAIDTMKRVFRYFI